MARIVPSDPVEEQRQDGCEHRAGEQHWLAAELDAAVDQLPEPVLAVVGAPEDCRSSAISRSPAARELRSWSPPNAERRSDEQLDGFGFDTGRRNRRGERLTLKTLGRAIGLTVGTAGFIAIVSIALI